MTSRLLLDNLQSWALQVFVIASIGAVLPLVFRIRHPRSQLAYCHLLLAACLFLPFIQPWQHPTVFVPTLKPAATLVSGGSSAAAAIEAAFPWSQVVAWTLVAGFAARLCWTAIGLWMIRRHKGAATPLYPIPESIREACLRTGSNALFCVSGDGVGPFTFGFLRPVVLLPASFMSLSAEAQCGIACHELLHVRRKDWLVNLLEELVGALFWFHPAVWWLLAQARLAREQIVDAEVVRVTRAQEPYIQALLAIAGVRPRLDVAPAPLFLKKRHLLQRMQLLVTEVSMSRFRLISSYMLIIALLLAAGWVGFLNFPLTGSAAIKELPAPVEPQQTSPGYVVNIQATRYPVEAIQKKIEGTVVVELTFNTAGNIIDSRVLSGPE
jgi:beta-lactamase regulating signal transducer with metallopeptidase domain